MLGPGIKAAYVYHYHLIRILFPHIAQTVSFNFVAYVSELQTYAQ